MAKFTKGDWMTFKRLCRYFVNKPRMQHVYQWHSVQATLNTYTDDGWAGCMETRKSIIGGCVTLCVHILKGCCKNPAFIAPMLFGEPEFYPVLNASAETLGMVVLPEDLGFSVSG